MLQGIETQVGQPRSLRVAIDAEHAASSRNICLRVNQKISPRAARFGLHNCCLIVCCNGSLVIAPLAASEASNFMILTAQFDNHVLIPEGDECAMRKDESVLLRVSTIVYITVDD